MDQVMVSNSKWYNMGTLCCKCQNFSLFW